MNYSNYPMAGLSSLLPGKTGFNWAGLLSGTQRTLNVVNQVIPIYNQVTPMFRNAKTMFKVAKEFKSLPEEKKEAITSDIEKPRITGGNNPIFYV